MQKVQPSQLFFIFMQLLYVSCLLLVYNCTAVSLFFLQVFKKADLDKKAEELDKMKAKYGLSTPGTDMRK